MYSSSRTGRRILLPTILAGVSLFPLARAAAQTSIGGVTVTAERSATAVAPSATPMEVVEPTSAITQGFIANNVAATANYDDIIRSRRA